MTTECGHSFHTSCMMKNVSHNGFACPMCRFTLAEEFEDDDDSDYDDDELEAFEDLEINTTEDAALLGVRTMFQHAENEGINDEDLDETTSDESGAEYEIRASEFTNFLKENGFCMEDLARAFMISSTSDNHFSYPESYFQTFYKIKHFGEKCFKRDIIADILHDDPHRDILHDDPLPQPLRLLDLFNDETQVNTPVTH
jgi:hypothetical protein